MGLARLAVTSTRFAVAIHRERCVAGCWQDDFRLRHSAKDSEACPRKADFGELSRVVGMAPGGKALRGERRISRRGAEHAEKAKTGEGEKPLRSMKSSQADKISNVCRATKGKSRRSNLVPLSFSACSAPLREILFVFAGGLTKRARLAEKSPGRMSPLIRSRFRLPEVRRVLVGRFPATTFCQGSKDMPTQSRGPWHPAQQLTIVPQSRTVS